MKTPQTTTTRRAFCVIVLSPLSCLVACLFLAAVCTLKADATISLRPTRPVLTRQFPILKFSSVNTGPETDIAWSEGPKMDDLAKGIGEFTLQPSTTIPAGNSTEPIVVGSIDYGGIFDKNWFSGRTRSGTLYWNYPDDPDHLHPVAVNAYRAPAIEAINLKLAGLRIEASKGKGVELTTDVVIKEQQQVEPKDPEANVEFEVVPTSGPIGTFSPAPTTKLDLLPDVYHVYPVNLGSFFISESASPGQSMQLTYIIKLINPSDPSDRSEPLKGTFTIFVAPESPSVFVTFALVGVLVLARRFGAKDQTVERRL